MENFINWLKGENTITIRESRKNVVIAILVVGILAFVGGNIFAQNYQSKMVKAIEVKVQTTEAPKK